jgi:hypothetical protein
VCGVGQERVCVFCLLVLDSVTSTPQGIRQPRLGPSYFFISKVTSKQPLMTCVFIRERELFIGTQFSNLYTAVDTTTRGRVVVCLVFVYLVCVCASMCSDILGSLSL